MHKVEVECGDHMIGQFPLGWFVLPAILQGWVDRVLRWAAPANKPLLTMRTVSPLANAPSSRSPPEAPLPLTYQPGGWNGDLQAILCPIQRGILRFTGFQVLSPHVVYAPVLLNPEERQAILTAEKARLSHLDEEPPLDPGIF